MKAGNQSSFRSALTEAAAITIAAVILGLIFTGIAGTGLFSSSAFPGRTATKEPVSSTFLTYEEARMLFLRGDALFIDARHGYDFGRGHIKGAINVPLQEFNNGHLLLTSVAKDRLIVTYCDGEDCNSSVELAKKMYAAGYSNVRIFFGGWNEWLAHGQPREP